MAPALATPRLRLRAWRDADLPLFAAMNADPRVMEFYPATLTRVESDALAGRIRAHLDEHAWGLWAVELAGSPAGAFLGYVGLAQPGFHAHFTPCMEIGWRLGYEHWGRGYATEAAQAVVRFAFECLELQELVSFTAALNLRSQRVMQRLGMRRDPADDFDHPLLPLAHPLRPHVLYRLAR